MKRWYLYPFSPFYHLATGIRNLMFDWGVLKSKKFDTPIIGVGNLNIGGSGKSPMVMYLAEFLSKHFRTGVLSRGYGRKTKGYKITNYESNFLTVGDEAMQLFQRFKNRFVIAVSEDRVLGAQKMIPEMDLDVVVLDDAYQHRSIKPGLNILMTDYNTPYFQDYILPAGNLRESKSGANRADIIVVSKCPDNLSEEKKQYYIAKIKPNKHQQVFFSSIVYDEHVFGSDSMLPDNNLGYYDILLITGIANPQPLLEHLARFSKRVKHLKFKDHHNFTDQDVKNILAEYNKMGEYKMILTTEKDYVRLKTFDYIKHLIYYWPINITIDRQSDFNKIIYKYVSQR